MIGLHGGDDTGAGDAVDVLGPQVLRMLDAEAAVPASVRVGHAVVDVEDEAIGSLADGVDGNLEPGGVGRADPPPHGIFRSSHDPARLRVVEIWIVEECGPRSERSIDIPLHTADPDPVVSPPLGRDGIDHVLPRFERKVECDPDRELAGPPGAQVRAEIGESGTYVSGRGDALRGGEAMARRSAASRCSSERAGSARSSGSFAPSLRMPVGSPSGVADDDPAGKHPRFAG